MRLCFAVASMNLFTTVASSNFADCYTLVVCSSFRPWDCFEQSQSFKVDQKRFDFEGCGP